MKVFIRLNVPHNYIFEILIKIFIKRFFFVHVITAHIIQNFIHVNQGIKNKLCFIPYKNCS